MYRNITKLRTARLAFDKGDFDKVRKSESYRRNLLFTMVRPGFSIFFMAEDYQNYQ